MHLMTVFSHPSTSLPLFSWADPGFTKLFVAARVPFTSRACNQKSEHMWRERHPGDICGGGNEATFEVRLSPAIPNAPNPPLAAVTRELTCEAGRCWWVCALTFAQQVMELFSRVCSRFKERPVAPRPPSRARHVSLERTERKEKDGQGSPCARLVGRGCHGNPLANPAYLPPPSRSSSVASQSPPVPPRSLPQLHSQMGCAQTGEIAHEYLWSGISLLLLLWLLLAPPPLIHPIPPPQPHLPNAALRLSFTVKRQRPRSCPSG